MTPRPPARIPGGLGCIDVRRAAAEDSPAVARVFGLAFEDYRRGFDIGPEALSRLWQTSLSARTDSTLVATSESGVVGFVVYVLPGVKERYGRDGDGRRQLGLWRQALGLGAFWRLPLLFVPMGLAYGRRHARNDELYVSLIGVDPAVQGHGIGQMLLGATEQIARTAGAHAVLLHTAGTNDRAQGAYRRAGYELVSTVRAPWRGPARISSYVALRKSLLPDATPRLDGLGF